MGICQGPGNPGRQQEYDDDEPGKHQACRYHCGVAVAADLKSASPVKVASVIVACFMPQSSFISASANGLKTSCASDSCRSAAAGAAKTAKSTRVIFAAVCGHDQIPLFLEQRWARGGDVGLFTRRRH